MSEQGKADMEEEINGLKKEKKDLEQQVERKKKESDTCTDCSIQFMNVCVCVCAGDGAEDEM